MNIRSHIPTLLIKRGVYSIYSTMINYPLVHDRSSFLTNFSFDYFIYAFITSPFGLIFLFLW